MSDAQAHKEIYERAKAEARAEAAVVTERLYTKACEERDEARRFLRQALRVVDLCAGPVNPDWYEAAVKIAGEEAR